MRKYLFCIYFFLLMNIGFSQTAANKVYTIKKDKIATIKSLNQIIPDFPKNITWYSLEIMVNVGGKHGAKFFKGNDPNAINLSFLGLAKVNSFIFITLKCRVESGEVVCRKYKVKAID